MVGLNRELEESGELVETRGLSAPVHTRRLRTAQGKPVVTDSPFAETEEVLAGYWIVECESFDRATEIAARLGHAPAPEHVAARAYAEVRPIAESRAELELPVPHGAWVLSAPRSRTPLATSSRRPTSVACSPRHDRPAGQDRSALTAPGRRLPGGLRPARERDLPARRPLLAAAVGRDRDLPGARTRAGRLLRLGVRRRLN